MTHTVFISYATQDIRVASAIYQGLKQRMIECWMAPQDIIPGSSYTNSITQAIEESNIFLLIVSSSSDQSSHVFKETERALQHKIPLLPIAIERFEPSTEMRYLIGSTQWIDGAGKDDDDLIAEIENTIRSMTFSNYSSVWRRTAAYIIDLCAIFVLWLIIILIIMVSLPVYMGEGAFQSFWWENAHTVKPEISSFMMGLGILVYAVYFIFAEKLPPLRSTIGKFVAGCRVLCTDGRRLTWKKAIFRGLLKITPLVVLSIMIPFTKKRQALHDMAAGTVVLKIKR